MHLLLQLGTDLLSDLGLHLLSAYSLVCGCGNSCPNSHKAFMSIQRQVSFFDGFLNVKCLLMCSMGAGVERSGLGHTFINWG